MADVHSKETRSYNMSRIKGKDKAWNAALVFRSSRCLFFLLLRQKKETKKRRFFSKGSAGKKGLYSVGAVRQAPAWRWF